MHAMRGLFLVVLARIAGCGAYAGAKSPHAEARPGYCFLGCWTEPEIWKEVRECFRTT